ncbi:MAG: uroporphyrinogen decarboxylase family protein [Candidatus Zixiibacteriota bacterium]
MNKDRLSHRERIQSILAGEKPDRFAASFWRHFFHMEGTAEGTIEAMLAFQKRFDWDFMKINPRADYHIEDWGFKQEYSRSEFEKHRKLAYPINTIEDWKKIGPLPTTSPVLAEHLKIVSELRRRSGPDLPIFMTVFTPLAIVGRMVPDNNMLVEHIRTDPGLILSALEAITVTFERFAVEVRNAGADGLFYATTHWASSDLLTWQEYQKFGVPYDLRVVRAAGDDAMNLFHVCAPNNYLRQLSAIDYSASMYNWDAADPTNMPLDKAVHAYPGKVLVGGVDHQGWLLRSDAAEMPHFVVEIKKKFDPSRVIIGPGCAIAPETPMENLQAIRDSL